jgi:hypothetical protein
MLWVEVAEEEKLWRDYWNPGIWSQKMKKTTHDIGQQSSLAKITKGRVKLI